MPGTIKLYAKRQKTGFTHTETYVTRAMGCSTLPKRHAVALMLCALTVGGYGFAAMLQMLQVEANF